MVYHRLLNKQTWRLGSCLLCRQPVPLIQDLCRSCHDNLPFITHLDNRCHQCAIALATSNIPRQLCGQCQSRTPQFKQVRALFPYAAPIDVLIQRLKYQGQLDLARVLGTIWARQLANLIQPAEVDLLMPVPLYRSRLRNRGFNQALELARPIARKLQIPIDCHSLCRTRHTVAQTNLSMKERTKNVRDAFEVRSNNIKGKHIVLVDDVVTTGSTVNTIAHILKKAGARQIEIWSLARA